MATVARQIEDRLKRGLPGIGFPHARIGSAAVTHDADDGRRYRAQAAHSPALEYVRPGGDRQKARAERMAAAQTTELASGSRSRSHKSRRDAVAGRIG